MKVDVIENMDCIEGMKNLPENSVDLVIAAPPYNLSKSGAWKWDKSLTLSGMGGNWNITDENWDSMPFKDYFAFNGEKILCNSWSNMLKIVINRWGCGHISGLNNLGGMLCFPMKKEKKLLIYILNTIKMEQP